MFLIKFGFVPDWVFLLTRHEGDKTPKQESKVLCKSNVFQLTYELFLADKIALVCTCDNALGVMYVLIRFQTEKNTTLIE